MVTIYVGRETKDQIEEISARRGMPRKIMMARLVNWFVRQDEYVLTYLLGSLSASSMAASLKSRRPPSRQP